MSGHGVDPDGIMHAVLIADNDITIIAGRFCYWNV